MKSLLILMILFLGVSCGKKEIHTDYKKNDEPYIQVMTDKITRVAGKNVDYSFTFSGYHSTKSFLKVKLLEKPQGLTLEKVYGATYRIKWKTSLADIGQHKVRVQVEDQSGLKSERKIIIEIKENQTPIITIKDSKYEHVVGNMLEFLLSVEDPDSDTQKFSFNLLNAPSGMYINKNYWSGNKIRWTPTKEQMGTHEVTFQVIDEFGRKTEKKLKLTIRKNKTPVIDPYEKIIKGKVGVRLDYEISVEDDNRSIRNTHTQELVNAPEGMTGKYDYNWDRYIITWTPEKNQVGEHKVTLVIKDKNAGVSKKELVFKIEQNILPIVTSDYDFNKEHAPKKLIILPFNVKDPDTKAWSLKYEIVSDQEGIYFGGYYIPKLHKSGDIYWTPQRKDIGIKNIVLKVTDTFSGESVLHTFTIKVRPFTEEEKKKFALENWNKIKKDQEKKSEIKKKWFKSLSKKKAKKNWKKIKDSLKVVNRFKPQKKLPREITSNRGKLFPLSTIRDVIQFPKYTTKEKEILINQVEDVLLNHYVNLKVKIDEFGNQADPTSELTKLKAAAAGLKEEEIHSRIKNIFFKLRDNHLNYILPIPYSCFGSYLPFQFSYAKNGDEEKVILTRIMDYTEHLAKNTPPSTIDTFKKVKPGYTLEKYSGQPIKEALLAMGKFNTGANIDAQRSSTLEYLTIRRHMKNFIPKKNKVLMEFKDQNGKKVTINFPWLTLYQCEQEKDGTLISTYDKYTLESGSNVLKNKKANVFKTSNQVASTQERKGTYLTSKIIGSSGYLQVPTFHVTKRDQFDKEMRDFISDLKKNGAESLIVDVRNNGGGYITLAEKLVQYLTKGEIELSRFRFKNTEKNIKYFSSPKFGGRNQNTFLGLAELLEGSNAYYSLTTPLLKRHHMEGTYVFQRENPFQQIDILTNSNCYSACDMFVAQMQDHGSAKVWGIDSKRTGAGGATVEVYSEFKARSTKYADFEVTPKLPGGQDMRFSFLQYIRNKKNAGKILENSGVLVDEVIYFKEHEIFSMRETVKKRLGLHF